MYKYKISINLHPSIPANNRLLVGEVSEETILEDALIRVLSEEEDIVKHLVVNKEIRPGYLLISDKTELRTTKKLKDRVSKDMEIKIIPISHGG